jgi:hypothetical protein
MRRTSTHGLGGPGTQAGNRRQAVFLCPLAAPCLWTGRRGGSKGPAGPCVQSANLVGSVHQRTTGEQPCRSPRVGETLRFNGRQHESPMCASRQAQRQNRLHRASNVGPTMPGRMSTSARPTRSWRVDSFVSINFQANRGMGRRGAPTTLMVDVCRKVALQDVAIRDAWQWSASAQLGSASP